MEGAGENFLQKVSLAPSNHLLSCCAQPFFIGNSCKSAMLPTGMPWLTRTPRLHMLHFLKNNNLFLRLVAMVSLALCPPILFSHFTEAYFISKYGFEDAEKTVSNVARLAAEAPAVVEGMYADRDSVARSQMVAFLETLTHVSNVKFIVPIDMAGIRLYHPEAEKIGAHIVGGDEGEALKGQTYISSARGSFGFSQRAFRPVYNRQGRQIGAVVVGIMSEDVEKKLALLIGPLTGMLWISLLVGVLLAVVLSRRIKKILFGLEPHQIARLLEERNAILSTVREGIMAINREGRLVVVNDMAQKILRAAGIEGELIGRAVQETVPSTRLDTMLNEGKPEYDCEQNINGVIIMTNRAPVRVEGKIIGAVATFRDMTEVRAMAERLTGLNNYTEALRSRSHEYLNKLHVVSGLLQNRRYEELETYLATIIGSKTRETSSIAAIVKDPIVAAFLESKYSRAHELGVTLSIGGPGIVPPLSTKGSRALVTILGNLIDNAFDAVTYSGERRIELELARCGEAGDQLSMSVADTGRGMTEEQMGNLFTKGYSTKGSNRGIGLYMLLLTLDEVDGSVEIASQLGHGSTFTVHIPLCRVTDGEQQ